MNTCVGLLQCFGHRLRRDRRSSCEIVNRTLCWIDENRFIFMRPICVCRLRLSSHVERILRERTQIRYSPLEKTIVRSRNVLYEHGLPAIPVNNIKKENSIRTF